MTGRHQDGLPTQGELLAQLCAESGYPIRSVSARTNRFGRLAEITWTVWHQRRWIDVQVLQVFSGRSFVVEDIASWLGKKSGQKIVMILRGGDMPKFARRYPNWTRRVLQRATRIIAPSDYLLRDLAWLGLDIQVIPNVLKVANYPYQHRTQLQPRLLWMRSFHEIYNPRLAVEMLSCVKLDIPEVRLTMAGPDKGLLTKVQALVNEKGLVDQVVFPGFLDFHDKLAAGAQHDIYLNTNRIDNMPVSVMEMAAMGLPIVATNVGGIPDLLTHRETGLLVPENDHEAMAEAVKHLLKEPELAGNLSANGRELAESCSWELVYPKWKQLLSNL
jgi:L-malate glycosyltransferase